MIYVVKPHQQEKKKLKLAFQAHGFLSGLIMASQKKSSEIK